MADRIKNYQQEADQITTLKAILTDLGVTPSSYTPDATVVTKDRVVTFAQAEEELVVLSDIEKGVKQQIVDVDIAQKDIANIKALLQGHLYDYQTDSTEAYTKSVPSGAMPYAGLEKVGGKTVVWNQLVDSGTTTVSTISGRKYYTLIDGTASIVTADGTAITIVDDSADMVCDLTIMFGAGNEPSTTDDFTAIFGATHYSYNAGTLLSAGVTEVVSKDGNNSTLQTYSIPASIQALEGYGWSAGSVYNYVDIENKKFIKNVGVHQFDGNEYANIYTSDSTRFVFFTNNTFGTGVVNRQIVVDKLAVNNTVSVINLGLFETQANKESNYSNFMYFCLPYSIKAGLSESSTNAEKVSAGKEWLANNNVKMYYQLNTPTETDISEYLTDDNLINVEAGGTLTFPNSNGTDYQIPVPSEEEYMIDLQSSL